MVKIFNKIADLFTEEVPENKGKEVRSHECSGCGRKYSSSEEKDKCEGTHDCCASKKEKKKGFWSGLYYGLIPHTFCILFIVGSILGATFMTSAFKPFLMNRNFFYILIMLSFAFATISALFYLKRNNCLCWSGARKRWKFLSVLYSTTVLINLLFFFVVFPAVANISTVSAATITAKAIDNQNLNTLILDVDIPCSGHAPLIIGELKTIQGVFDVKYVSGKFNVIYDPSKTTKEEILALKIFKEYPATVVSESKSNINAGASITGAETATAPASGSGGCCGGSGSCGSGGGACCGGRG